ncbi:MAG: MATE family efflux transporter [Halieaceae bacterium]|jgi:MATE family multidrug resistance protein|nr:MATE family efflux transporter [Halieaceae bacterium]
MQTPQPTTHSVTDHPSETRTLLKLAGPLVVNNLALAGMQFADAVMAGKLGAEALAAVAIGSSVWFLFFMVLLGLMMALSPIVSRHIGAGNPHLVGRYTRQAILMALALSIPVVLAAEYAVPGFLELLTIDPSFRDITAGYVAAIAWGAPGIFVFLALRFTSEGVGYTKPIMLTSLLALVCNVSLNWVFIYGKLGAPALGAVGCGVASAITMWVVMFVLGIYMLRSARYRAYQLFVGRLRFDATVLKEIIRLGIPIAVTVTAEAGLFNAISLLMGTLGANAAAAHQVALNFASTTFMVPLAISAATTVRVGYWLGRDDLEQARRSGLIGIACCTLIMVVSASFLLMASDWVVKLYTDDPAVTAIAVSLLLMAAIFQIADGLQVGAAGALRGYKDTRLPMIITTFAYWVVAFPLAFMAAVVWRLDPHWVWSGFVAGLCLAGLLLGGRFWLLSRAHRARDIPALS